MSVSLQLGQPRLDKNTYFTSNGRLYYIIDVMKPDYDFYLVEDCLTLNTKWMGADLLLKLEKEVIRA